MKLNQEDILQLIQKESWKPVLHFLYSYRNEIKTDPLLTFSATVFESEFFRKLEDESKTIEYDDLEQLYILHNGKFFILSEKDYEKLVAKLAIQSNGRSAYNYAMLFPENEICKGIISTYIETNTENRDNKESSFKQLDKMNWIEIYNRLFEVINNQSDQSVYFSGPRYINTLREFDPYHPDYTQYIELRNEQGKSTSRRIFYYDILMGLDERKRVAFLDRILKMIEPFEKERVIQIQALLHGGKPKTKHANIEELPKDVPTVFISYSWDDEEHKRWVLNLANRLVDERVNVLLDRYELRLGRNLPLFVETSIRNADRIIIVFTPNYKLKAEKRDGGVGYEYSIMNAELYENQTNNEKIIPVLRNGSKTDSIPEFMQQYIHLDMKLDANFETSFTDLLREIYNEPEIAKPKLGEKRKISNN